MRHVADGTLRRLDDEPLAVPDRFVDHVTGCVRCAARRERIGRDAGRAARLLSSPQLVPDLDRAWHRLQRALPESAPRRAARRPVAGRSRVTGSRWLPLRTGLVVGAVGIVAAGTAAAATLTTVFAPTHVAPVSLTQSDMQTIAAITGLGDGHVLGGFPSPSGSRSLPFGTITWSSSGPAREVATLAQASAAAGYPVRLPASLPSGVGPVQGRIVQPEVRVKVAFKSTAAGVGGSSVVLDAGPAVLVEYGSASGADLPTLAVLTMPRPAAVSTGAGMARIETFLLSRPGMPQQLAEEIRLLGDLSTTLPVPIPPGASVRSVQIGGSPGVLVVDASNAAAGAIWEDPHGTLRLVVGIVDARDLLHVADQLG